MRHGVSDGSDHLSTFWVALRRAEFDYSELFRVPRLAGSSGKVVLELDQDLLCFAFGQRVVSGSRMMQVMTAMSDG